MVVKSLQVKWHDCGHRGCGERQRERGQMGVGVLFLLGLWVGHLRFHGVCLIDEFKR